jgi:transposase
LSKLGEDVTKTLEIVPRRWKLIETVREKFSCRACQTITQPSAPFHATPRGFIGPRLLATILFDKFGQHIPLNLQSERFRCALFDIERTIHGLSADERRRVRQDKSAPLVVELEAWLREQRSKLSRSAPVIKPIDYMLKRWSDFARFVDDGRICLTNNAAERALRGLALGRKAWLFAGSDRGAERAAVMFTLIMTAKLNDVDPQAWLADVFARIASLPQNRLHELLPWEWKKLHLQAAA